MTQGEGWLAVILILGSVFGALSVIHLAYGASVRRVMRTDAPRTSELASRSSPGPSVEVTVEAAERSEAATSRRVSASMDALRARRRRRLIVTVIALAAVAFAQILIFLLVVEPGSARAPAIYVGTLIFCVPSILGWWVGSLVSRGRQSDLGLLAGASSGVPMGIALFLATTGVGQVRIVTLLVLVLLAVIVAYIVLFAASLLMLGLRRLVWLSPETTTAVLAGLVAGVGWTSGFGDGQRAWALAIPALALPPLVGLLAGAIRAPEETPDLVGRRLLLLRTFGHAKRSDGLLRSVAREWLEIGEIDLVAGPDLAASVVTAEKLALWLRGRLAEAFIRDVDDFRRRERGLEVRPYRDGRFRVREYACLDGGWRDTVVVLARRADVVLMDLRHFSRGNAGCIFELETLLSIVGTQRCVFVVDSSTDHAALGEVLRSMPALEDAPSGKAADRVVTNDISSLRTPPGELLTRLLLHRLPQPPLTAT